MSEMAKRIEERPFAILDINMGCPVPKVVKNGEGSALMKNPSLVYEIVNAIVKAIEKPVTVKIRKGFDDAHVNAVEVARAAEEAGASRRGGLGHYQAGERGGFHSCNRKRRCHYTGKSRRTCSNDRMRRNYDRKRRTGKPVDLFGNDRQGKKRSNSAQT